MNFFIGGYRRFTFLTALWVLVSREGERGAIVLTEFILSRGELLSSISLSSSSKSVSNISVASDIGLAASCRMLKNASLGCPFWNISTRWSMGVVGEYPGWLRVSKEHRVVLMGAISLPYCPMYSGVSLKVKELLEH
jgi:hypothetical protein